MGQMPHAQTTNRMETIIRNYGAYCNSTDYNVKKADEAILRGILAKERARKQEEWAKEQMAKLAKEFGIAEDPMEKLEGIKYRKCSKCGRRKAMTMFSRSNSEIGGYNYYCKDCHRQYRREKEGKDESLCRKLEKRHERRKSEPKDMKHCTVCGQLKPLAEFYPSKVGRKGRDCKCKHCYSVERAEQYQRRRAQA